MDILLIGNVGNLVQRRVVAKPFLAVRVSPLSHPRKPQPPQLVILALLYISNSGVD